MSELLRLYGPAELGPDGYPSAWHHASWVAVADATPPVMEERLPPIKEIVRELAGHRCERCGHPYPPGIALDSPRGEWTPCDEQCEHEGPVRVVNERGELRGLYPDRYGLDTARAGWTEADDHGETVTLQAQWRILTVHHLNGVKWDCRWWNLAALCQRCHLTIQGRVVMERVYPHPHTEWFKPHAAGWYAADYYGLDLTREEVMARLDELLALELDPSYTRT